MSSLKPVIHGRDHLPGGADPIPVAALQAALFDPQSATEWLEATTITVDGTGGSNEGTFVLSHLSGPALVTSGAVTTKGVYTIDVVSLGQEATSRNRYSLEVNMVQASYTAALFVQDVYSDGMEDLEASVSVTGVMNVGDTFLLKVANYDSASRDFSCPSVRVTKIIELT